MKKTTSKTTKSPAPAKKSAAPVPKKKAAAAVKPAAVKPVATTPIETTITAQIDIGFGNALYIRGTGPGLSWDRGVLMECVADSQWQVVLGESARPITFKFLVNDLSWSAGEDYTVPPGGRTTLAPSF